MMDTSDYKRLISAYQMSPGTKRLGDMVKLKKGLLKLLGHAAPDVMASREGIVVPDLGRRDMQRVLSYLEGEGYRIVKVKDIKATFGESYPGQHEAEDAKLIQIAPRHMVLGSDGASMRFRFANFEVDLVGYTNPTGLLAIQIDGEGPLVLPNGKRIPSGHRAWNESFDPVNNRNLSREQVKAVDDAIEAQRREAISRQMKQKRKEEEIEKQRIQEQLDAAAAIERRREKERREMARSNRAVKLWDSITSQIWKDTAKGVDAVDMFYGWDDPGWRNRPDPDSFDGHLSGVAGDVGMDYEYALSDKAYKLYDRYMLLVDKNGYDLMDRGLPSSRREVKQILRDLYADAWADAAFQEYERFQKSRRYPEVVAEKYIGWNQWRKLSPALKKQVLSLLKRKVDTKTILQARHLVNAIVGSNP